MDSQAETCPSCQARYDGGKKRKLIDSCGHSRCFTCMYSTDSCPLCSAAKTGQAPAQTVNGGTSYSQSHNSKSANSPTRAASFNNGTHYSVPYHSYKPDGGSRGNYRDSAGSRDHYREPAVQRSASYRVVSSVDGRQKYGE